MAAYSLIALYLMDSSLLDELPAPFLERAEMVPWQVAGRGGELAMSDFATLELEERREEHRRAASGEGYLRLMQLPPSQPMSAH